MKSRRKIWSIPIAALALVLMLVGGLVATGVVQAQAPTPRPSLANSNIKVAVNGDAAIDATIATIVVDDPGTAAVVDANDRGAG